MVPQWFVSKRGRALSVLAIGGALSAAGLPLFNLKIIEAWGWRAMWQVWSLVLLLVMAPLAWYFTRERPEQIGMLPDGVPRQALPDKATEVDLSPSWTEPAGETSWTAAEAMRTPAFWIILVATSIPSMVGTGAQFHHMSILTGNGISATVAASVFAISAGVRMAAIPLAGYLCDRLPVRHMLCAGLLFQAAALLLLPVTVSAGGAVLLGVTMGLKLSVLALMSSIVWPHYFGRRYLASIRGITTAGMVISSALGPLPFGAGYDWFGSYTQVILLMAVLPLAGAVGVMWLRTPHKKDLGQDSEHGQSSGVARATAAAEK
jgi:MFS family permease